MLNKIRIGTRGSKLALWQAQHVKGLLEAHFPGVIIEIQKIKTTGDNILDAPLSKIASKGFFTKEIETALLEERIDLAVHSFKDVPTIIPDGLIITAVLEREDAHDIFIANSRKSCQSFVELPQRPVIATGSLRRKSQILNIRPDAEIIEIRGNLDTRINKLNESDWDGIIIAKAGLIRLGLTQCNIEILPFEKMLPAVGQGALAIEIRYSDKHMEEMLRPIHHAQTACAIAAERALLKHLEGGCQIPIGAYGQILNNNIQLDAVIGSLDGKHFVRGSKNGPISETENIGIELAKELINRGGAEILAQNNRIS